MFKIRNIENYMCSKLIYLYLRPISNNYIICLLFKNGFRLIQRHRYRNKCRNQEGKRKIKYEVDID